MKIKTFKTIKKYKSFADFSWQKFLNNATFHSEMNVIFGENGTGKSSLVQILKSLCEEKSFEHAIPEKVEVVSDQNFVFENGSWNHKLDKASIIFFDREFVQKHVHLGHKRERQQGGHEQESGKLIIAFDQNAIELRENKEQLNEAKKKIETEISEFLKSNHEVLELVLSDEEKEMFVLYKDRDVAEIAKNKKDLEKEIEEIKKQLEMDRKKQKIVSNIQQITEVQKPVVHLGIPSQEDIESLFKTKIIQQVKADVSEKISERLKNHKDFIASGLDIRKTSPKECPFCFSTNREDQIEEIAKAYTQVFDQSYKQKQADFYKKRQSLFTEMETLSNIVDGIGTSQMFIHLKKIQEEFNIPDIYTVEEESSMVKPKCEKLLELKGKIQNFEAGGSINVSDLYKEMHAEVDAVREFLVRVHDYINKKNELIKNFKSSNTDQSLTARLNKNSKNLEKNRIVLEFLNEKKCSLENKRIKTKKELDKLNTGLETVKKEYVKTKTAYEEYVSSTAFIELLKRIEGYFSSFHFKFKLELDTERRSAVTKEYPFAFKVIDEKGDERDFEDGLSDGELQVLSLCFFFAYLDVQKDRAQKVLVFDDPITSLDNGNLYCLVELIFEEHINFSQTFVFTHHKTFKKFLVKKQRVVTESDAQKNCYAIVRNHHSLGGSFICSSFREKFDAKLRDLEQHLQRIPPQNLDVELKIVEYGQYLRYESERFIKNSLLQWNASDFPSAIEGLKNTKKIDDADLDKIKKIYQFCNWTSAHVDVGDDHGLNNLKVNINEYLGVKDKYPDC